MFILKSGACGDVFLGIGQEVKSRGDLAVISTEIVGFVIINHFNIFEVYVTVYR